jgi:hypothetical protein
LATAIPGFPPSRECNSTLTLGNGPGAGAHGRAREDRAKEIRADPTRRSSGWSFILLKWSIAAIPVVLLGLILLGLWIAVLGVIMWQMPLMPIAP